MKYPLGVQSSEKLLSLSVVYFWPTLKKIFSIILIFVFLKAIYSHISFPRPVATVLAWVLAVIDIFLFVWALVQVDKEFKGEPASLADTLILAFRLCWRAYLVCVLAVIIFMLLFGLGHWFVSSLAKLQGATAGFAIIILVGIPFVLVLIFFYLSIPLSVIYPQPLGAVLYYSALYAQKRFFLVLMIYSELIIMFFISSTNTRHGQWLLSRHLMELTDVVTFSIVMPLLINLSLLLLYDCRLRTK